MLASAVGVHKRQLLGSDQIGSVRRLLRWMDRDVDALIFVHSSGASSAKS
jgi:hypothetical protein